MTDELACEIRTALRRCQEDVIQTVLLLLLEREIAGTFPNNPVAWARSAARRVAYTARRAARRASTRERASVVQRIEPAVQERRVAAREIIDRLPAELVAHALGEPDGLSRAARCRRRAKAATLL